MDPTGLYWYGRLATATTVFRKAHHQRQVLGHPDEDGAPPKRTFDIAIGVILALWYLFPDYRFIFIPFCIVLIYLITLVILKNRKLPTG
jgi:hypothetical protein